MIMGDYPDCFIIGLPKAGTTALYNILTQSSEVFDCPVKEPNFFLPEGVTPAGVRNQHDYVGLYSEAKDNKLLSIDASISYAHFPDSLEKIVKVKPDAKFVIILRRPEKLVLSQYQQMRYGLFEECESFRLAWVDRITNGQPASGNYQFARNYPESGAVGSILEKVMAVVPSDSLKILIYEEIFSQESKDIIMLSEFLGIQPFEFRMKKVNARKEPASKIVHRLIIKDSWIFKLFRLLVKKIPFISPGHVRRFYDKKMVKPVDASLSDYGELEIEKYFEAEKRKVEDLLSKKIPSWWC
mgnify:CR=1 FL=1